MLQRLHELPAWVLVLYFAMLAAIVLGYLWSRLRDFRERRAEFLRDVHDRGYSWAWREFWFAPRQRKLPPPPGRSE